MATGSILTGGTVTAVMVTVTGIRLKASGKATRGTVKAVMKIRLRLTILIATLTVKAATRRLEVLK